MWPAKLPGEGVALYDACRAVCEAMTSLGVAIDGGKDSLSMAARVGDETVKSPGSLVISVYAPCPDITATVTPDIKHFNGKGSILYVKLDNEHCRLGGSALAHVFNQIGDVSPDVDRPEVFSKYRGFRRGLLEVFGLGELSVQGFHHSSLGPHGAYFVIPENLRFCNLEVLNPQLS